jgi:hypothetical protein
MKTLLTELGAIKQTLQRSGAGDELRSRARAMELEVLDLQVRLMGDEKRGLAGDPGPVSVARRVNIVQLGTSFSTYGPTAMHKRNLEIGEQDFAGIKSALKRLFDTELPALRKALDDAGVPWTPGRGVPGKS